MNNGRICISVHAPTVTEFIERIEAATGNADLIELRFDYLEPDELYAEDIDMLKVIREKIVNSAARTRCITTFRPIEYGGHRSISRLERENFWNIGFETELADLEEDIVEWSWGWCWGERICSFHDFDGVPADLDLIFERLAQTDADIVKIAANVEDAAEAIPIWSLLERSRIKMIPIAMGEAGKWTRILGLAHGAPITYASPEDGQATAPGQISASVLAEVFRVKELDRDTQVFGIVAGNTSYSLSPFMHNAAFKAAQMNSVFVPFQVRDLDGFIHRMVRPSTREVKLNFRGLSVTNPHKETIIPYLDEIDATAKAIGAVNTVMIDGDKLVGFNTDAGGFLAPLERKFTDLRGSRAVVVGAGGAARACVYALKHAGADVTVIARDRAKAATFSNDFGVSVHELEAGDWKLATGTNEQSIPFDIVVNATPLGTRGPNENETIATAENLSNVKLVYDLVYNPSETRLLREAKAAGVQTLGGLEMLIAQGAKQFEIWTGRDAPLAPMRAALEKRLQ